jgi:hypothetical protein
MKVTVHKAENLKENNFAGKYDTYVSIRYGGDCYEFKASEQHT